MSDESGFTLVEMLVTMFAGVIVFMAILTTIDVATRSQQRVDQRVAADQRARPVMTHIIDELHSACVATGVAPVLAGDDSSITFLSKTGSDVSPIPDKHVITLTGTTLSETTYQGTGGTAPDWTFSSSPTTNQLLDGVGAGSVDGSSVAPVPVLRLHGWPAFLVPDHPAPHSNDRCADRTGVGRLRRRPDRERPFDCRCQRVDHSVRFSRPAPAVRNRPRGPHRSEQAMRMKRLARDESGFTMLAVIGAIALVSLLAAAAFAATNSDLNLTSRNLKVQRAYAAAQAGINAYSFHLSTDNSYWTTCTDVPTPNAVNQEGSTANRLPVPGFADASYAIELLPATGSSACDPNSPPFYGMLEQNGSSGGTFRIRSTGFVGDTKQSVVATFKRAAFLDYVYFTQLETSDPVTYGFANPSAALNGAYSQCGKFRRDGRESAPIPNSGGEFCDRIVFADDDAINGPLHTNDDSRWSAALRTSAETPRM